jgi:7,8-dihydropterin-6-yl-methyl-4-(beta-D-ribofuranosyl)aminobenzene 5'-phosphate synthase
MAMTGSSEAAELAAVEQLEVQVLVDNVTDGLSTNPEHIHSEMRCHVVHGLQVLSGQAICCANHGLSLVITARTGKDRQTVLFDAGPEGYAVERNGDRLHIDFGGVDAVVLSHGHWDHAGGLLEAIRLVRRARPEGPLPCHLHPGMFRQRGLRLPTGKVLPMADVPTPEDYQRAGAEPVVNDHACTILQGSHFISGEISRVTPYERGLVGHVARSGSEGEWEPDPLIMDERFLAVHVKDKGLVVFTACSHAGLVNVLREARRCFPRIPLHAVIGGFHLAGTGMEAIIPDTVRHLADFDLRWIIPSHCTGWRALHALLSAFGEERVVPNAVGKKIVL